MCTCWHCIDWHWMIAHILGAYSTGACAPVLIKKPGQRSPFAPVTFRESTIYRLDCASTGVLGCPSLCQCVDLSVSKCFAEASTSTLIGHWAFNTLLQFTKCWKERWNPAHSLTHSLTHSLDFIELTTLTSATKRWNQHQLTSGNCLNCPLKLHTTNDRHC